MRARERRGRRVATRIVGKWCGFFDMVSFFDADDVGRDEEADAGGFVDVEVGDGIIVVTIVFIIAGWLVSISAHRPNQRKTYFL